MWTLFVLVFFFFFLVILVAAVRRWIWIFTYPEVQLWNKRCVFFFLTYSSSFLAFTH